MDRTTLRVCNRPGAYTIPIKGLSPRTLALLRGPNPAVLSRVRPHLSRDSTLNSRTWSKGAATPLKSHPHPSYLPQKAEKPPTLKLYKDTSQYLEDIVLPEDKKGSEGKPFWKTVKVVARDINYAINYNGQKDASTKKTSVLTRIAAIALPIIQTFVPEFQIAISAFKTMYSGAQMLGLVDKEAKVITKEKTKGIQSALSRGILSVGIAVAVYFGSRIAVVVFAVLKIGMDILDLRNSVVEKGWTKEATLILIKTAGTVAYLALAIFDSNLVLIFSIASKVAVNLFTAYCEASQGRWPEAIAAVVFAGLTNLSSIQSVVASAQAGTLPDSGVGTLSTTSTAGVTDMRPDETDKVFKELKALQNAAQKRKREEERRLEEEREQELQARRLYDRNFARMTAERLLEAEGVA